MSDIVVVGGFLRQVTGEDASHTLPCFVQSCKIVPSPMSPRMVSRRIAFWAKNPALRPAVKEQSARVPRPGRFIFLEHPVQTDAVRFLQPCWRTARHPSDSGLNGTSFRIASLEPRRLCSSCQFLTHLNEFSQSGSIPDRRALSLWVQYRNTPPWHQCTTP
jgi:hypothetical protein